MPKIYINYRRERGKSASFVWTSSNVLINIHNYLHNNHRPTTHPPLVFVKNVIIAIAARIISIWNKTVKNRMEPVSNSTKHFLAFSFFVVCIFIIKLVILLGFLKFMMQFIMDKLYRHNKQCCVFFLFFCSIMVPKIARIKRFIRMYRL